MAQIRHFRHMSLLLVAFHLSACYMWFQPLSKVGSTHDRVRDSQDDEYNRDHSERCEFLTGWFVRCLFGMLIHTDEFEYEVGQRDEV